MAHPTSPQDMENMECAIGGMNLDDSVPTTTPTAAVPTTASQESANAEIAPTSPFNYDAIPDRVECHVPIKIAKSHLKSTGDGIFILEAVKEGDLAFCVKQPLMNIVSLYLMPVESRLTCSLGS